MSDWEPKPTDTHVAVKRRLLDVQHPKGTYSPPWLATIEPWAFDNIAHPNSTAPWRSAEWVEAAEAVIEAGEGLQELYDVLLSGDFYADHDQSTELLGRLRRCVEARRAVDQARSRRDG